MGHHEHFFLFHYLEECFLLVSENRHERKHSFQSIFSAFCAQTYGFLKKIKKWANFGPGLFFPSL